MEVYLQSLGMNVWKSIEDIYEFLKAADESEDNGEHSISWTTTVDPENRKKYEWNAQANNVILCSIVHVEFTKLMQCTATKVWEYYKPNS